MQYAEDVLDAGLDARFDRIGPAPFLALWDGDKPRNCAAHARGIKVAEGQLPANWMEPSRNGSKVKAGEWKVTGLRAAAGVAVARYFRVMHGGRCRLQGVITRKGGGGDAEMDDPRVRHGQECIVSAFKVVAGNR